MGLYHTKKCCVARTNSRKKRANRTGENICKLNLIKYSYPSSIKKFKILNKNTSQTIQLRTGKGYSFSEAERQMGNRNFKKFSELMDAEERLRVKLAQLKYFYFLRQV